jgi:hypothetical protein
LKISVTVVGNTWQVSGYLYPIVEYREWSVWLADCILNEGLHPSTEITLISIQFGYFCE